MFEAPIVAKKKPGRPPSELSDALAAQLLEAAKAGATDVDLARVAGIGLATFSTWKHRYPDFREALKEAKSTADEFVEDALYRRACGYSHPEVKVFCNKNGEITEHEVEKHYPPDTTAMIFWLKNRQPKRWRDRQEVVTENITPFIIVKRDGTAVELGAKVEKEEE